MANSVTRYQSAPAASACCTRSGVSVPRSSTWRVVIAPLRARSGVVRPGCLAHGLRLLLCGPAAAHPANGLHHECEQLQVRPLGAAIGGRPAVELDAALA